MLRLMISTRPLCAFMVVFMVVMSAPSGAYAELPPENGRKVGEYFAAGSTALVSLVAVAAAAEVHESAAAVSFFLIPAAMGAVACWIGDRSPYYTGSCVSPIIGAYLGSLAGVLILLGTLHDCDGGEPGFPCLGVSPLGLLGMLVAPPLGATLGWNLFKTPRSGLALGPSPARLERPVFAPSRSKVTRGFTNGDVSVPLAAFAF